MLEGKKTVKPDLGSLQAGARAIVKTDSKLVVGKSLEVEKGHGILYPEGAMFLRQEVGSAKIEETGDEFELSTGMSGAPIITRKLTAKQKAALGLTLDPVWMIPWPKLIDLARGEGL